MDCDAGAMYVAVDLWSMAPWSQDPVTLRRMLKRTCILTTAALFPELNPNSGNRFPPHLALAAFGVPARKPSGVYHSHLFLRVPPAASSSDLRKVAIQELGRRTIVRAPVAVASFVNTFRRLNEVAVSSVHLVHDHANDPSVIDLAADPKRRGQRLEYLLGEGPELRDWSDAIHGAIQDLVAGDQERRLGFQAIAVTSLPALRYATASPGS